MAAANGGGDSLAQILPLEASYVGDADAAGQIGVLAVGLLGASPARIPADIQDGRQGLAGSHGAHLQADHLGEGLDQLRIPAAGQPDRLRKLRGVPGHEARAALLVHDGWDPETGPLAQEQIPGALLGEGPFLDEPTGPDTAELGELLVQGHAPQQGGRPRLDGGGRVPVELGHRSLAIRRLLPTTRRATLS